MEEKSVHAISFLLIIFTCDSFFSVYRDILFMYDFN